MGLVGTVVFLLPRFLAWVSQTFLPHTDAGRRPSGNPRGHGAADHLYSQGEQLPSSLAQPRGGCWPGAAIWPQPQAAWSSPGWGSFARLPGLCWRQQPACACVCTGETRARVLISAVCSPPPASQAGITTTLNSRCSVLAAANSVFGRWDETKGEDNIDFMPTILSRFDMIFIVKDEHNEERDVVRQELAGAMGARPVVLGEGKQGAWPKVLPVRLACRQAAPGVWGGCGLQRMLD